MMHVVAGVMTDAQGRVLLAQRPPGKHLAGLWEFPGGKLEPGESVQAGLRRELQEELGVDTRDYAPLIRLPWRYGERSLLLDVWRVGRWQGAPRSMEGQALQWCDPRRVDAATLAPADRMILHALRLPGRYLATPEQAALGGREHWLHRLRAALDRGERLLHLRLPAWPREAVRELAAALLPQARALDARLLLDGDVEGALALGEGVGVQLDAAGLQGASAQERPLPWSQPVGVGCRDAGQLDHAVQLGADFATLSPVASEAAREGAPALGWPGFRQLAEAASLPVYALGGLRPEDERQARAAGGQGVAGCLGFW
ncbi:Nudix family hydrolase [Frateuria defendens]|uniref:Nudix family hydrolase n=1 Tax=Frateuria defendens TaxID=2219559 RepID=UPI000ACEA044|nr:Nudix family hydrolase [Frateuria defendens]